MKISTLVKRKIEKYQPQGSLDQTAKIFLALSGVQHPEVKVHLERVALLSEAVALKLHKDGKAAFFAGLLHDIGKIVLPYYLFDGRNITAEEYAEVKRHAVAGVEALKDFHEFTALCAGLHHAVYKAGYGLTVEDFPKHWNPATIKKVLNISTIISICDFVDAYSHRDTKIKDGSDEAGPTLREMLLGKYPEDRLLIDAALEENKKKQYSE